MLREEDYFVLNTDYKLAIHHGLLSEARAESMRKEMDDVSWAMEMEGKHKKMIDIPNRKGKNCFDYEEEPKAQPKKKHKWFKRKGD